MSSTLSIITTRVSWATFPLIISLGIIANFLNILILRRATLRNKTCALYFLVLSINNLIYMCTDVMYSFVLACFGIDLTLYSDWSCHLIWFLLDFLPHFSLYMLVLASLDRYFCSSVSARLRRLSTFRTAKYLILAALMFAVLFLIGTALMAHLYGGDNPQCVSVSGNWFNNILKSAQIIVYVFIGPFLMILFGLLTIHNISRLKKNNASTFHYRLNEKQLTTMLIVQVSTHIILCLPFSVIFFMTIIPTPLLYTEIYAFLFTIFKIPFYIDFITPFFLYILSAKLYRRELVALIRKVFRRNQNTIIHPIGI